MLLKATSLIPYDIANLIFFKSLIQFAIHNYLVSSVIKHKVVQKIVMRITVKFRVGTKRILQEMAQEVSRLKIMDNGEDLIECHTKVQNI